MKYSIIKSSQLTPINGYSCWLPIRFLHECNKCTKFKTCPLPEPKGQLEERNILFGTKNPLI